MAINKTQKWIPAIVHAMFYTIPFLFLTSSVTAIMIICLTHLLIDRFRLANYITKIKNWHWITASGYPENTPVWLSTWLMIITDNTLHLLINYLALKS